MRYSEDMEERKLPDGRAISIHRADARVLQGCGAHVSRWDAIVADRDRLIAFYKAVSLLGLNINDDPESFDFDHEVSLWEGLKAVCRIRGMKGIKRVK